MIQLRKSQDRGHAQHGWLDSYHTFSFAEYYEPAFMGFRDLRVINEDIIEAAQGFGKHPHHDMEIITYVVEGQLEHKDSMGTGSIIRPGEIQAMSAGTGVQHSEFNHSNTERLHLLQIWILPEKKGISPSYQQKTIAKVDNQLILIASAHPTDQAITIHQDVNLYSAYLSPKHEIRHDLQKNRHGWLQLITGEIELNGNKLLAGDGAAISEESSLVIKGMSQAEFLFFDLK